MNVKELQGTRYKVQGTTRRKGIVDFDALTVPSDQVILYCYCKNFQNVMDL